MLLNKFDCPEKLCHKRFTRKEDVTRHVKRKHTENQAELIHQFHFELDDLDFVDPVVHAFKPTKYRRPMEVTPKKKTNAKAPISILHEDLFLSDSDSEAPTELYNPEKPEMPFVKQRTPPVKSQEPKSGPALKITPTSNPKTTTTTTKCTQADLKLKIGDIMSVMKQMKEDPITTLNLRYALDQAYTILENAVNPARIDLTEDSNDMKTNQISCTNSDTDPWEQMNWEDY